MTTFNIGHFPEKDAKALVDAINSTPNYMQLHATYGIMPGGYPVTISTDYDDDYVSIAEFVMYILASSRL